MNLEELNSHIAVVSNLEEYKTSLTEELQPSRLKLFFKDDFLIDDAKAVVKEAYVAENDKKVIALGAKSYNIYAQNSLLKVLEEPPRNVIFIVAVSSKTSLLPTIRSRLPLNVIKSKKEKISTGLNFRTLDLQDIYDFIGERKFLEKRELKSTIESITTEALSQGVRFTDEELNLFHKLLQLAELNSRPQNLLTTQLITILNRSYQ